MVFLQGEEGGVEPLDMPHLDDEVLRPGRVDERARLVGRRRDRLFDEDVQAALQRFGSYGIMGARRSRDAHRLDRFQELVQGRARRRVFALRYFPEFRGVCVVHGRELRLRNLSEHFCVKRPEMPQSDNADSHLFHTFIE